MKWGFLAVALGAVAAVVAVVGVAFGGPTDVEIERNADATCRQFHATYLEWVVEIRAGDADRQEADPAVTDLAEQLAPDVLDEDLRERITLASRPGDTLVPKAKQVINRCRSLGVGVGVPDVPPLKKTDSPAAASPDSPPATRSSESLQREALELMWDTTSATEQSVTCELFQSSPNSVIGGFMEAAGGQMDEDLVRDFYKRKCG